jgi:hypothetical protein
LLDITEQQRGHCQLHRTIAHTVHTYKKHMHMHACTCLLDITEQQRRHHDVRCSIAHAHSMHTHKNHTHACTCFDITEQQRGHHEVYRGRRARHARLGVCGGIGLHNLQVVERTTLLPVAFTATEQKRIQKNRDRHAGSFHAPSMMKVRTHLGWVVQHLHAPHRQKWSRRPLFDHQWVVH